MNDSSSTDPTTLISQARAGHEPARGRLLERYRDYLKLLARMQLGSRMQAKLDPSDLAQETCLYAHQYFGTFRGTTEGQLIAWLRTILADRTAKQVRHFTRGKRDVNLEKRFEHDLNESSRALEKAVAADQTSPSERAIRREQSVVLASALEQLPAHYREVMVLHHLQGIPLRDVAAQMGRTHDSIRKLWVRSMMKLRTLIKD